MDLEALIQKYKGMLPKGDELYQLLIQVKRSYPDFVAGILSDCIDFPEITDKVILFMKEHPEANAGEVCHFVDNIPVVAEYFLEHCDDEEEEA